MTDGIVTNGYCVAKREADGRLAWDSPENHLLAAYWDRDEQFRNKSVQYVMPPGWTNDLKNVWVDREKLAEYVDIAIKENAKIGNELMRIKTAYSYDSEGRPEIDLSAMANVVRCYWCARMVRCAEKGELEGAKNEMCALIDMAETITCYGKTEKELGFAKVLLQNARECLRAILPKIKGDEVYSLCLLETIRVSLDLIRVARPPKERAALAEMLHEIDMLRKEWQNEIEDFLREEKMKALCEKIKAVLRPVDMSRASRTTTPSSRSSPRCNSRGMSALLRGRAKRGAAYLPRRVFHLFAVFRAGLSRAWLAFCRGGGCCSLP